MRPKWLINAMNRLRLVAQLRAVRDADGRIIQEGNPPPMLVEQELKRAYRRGLAAAEREEK